MPNFTEIPFGAPFKFVKNTTTPGIHLDDDFAVNQIKSYQRKVCYAQKWQIGDETPFQIVSTVAPSPMKVFTSASVDTELEFAWELVGVGESLGVGLYECVINMDTLPTNAFYHFYFECTLLSYSAKFVSERIDLRPLHKNTLLFAFRNSYNKIGFYFHTGIIPKFRCEAALLDYQPEIEGKDYIDQIRDRSILSATPFDTFKLYIGEAPGVPNYVVKILNHIFSCDYVAIKSKLSDPGLQFVKPVGEKWEPTRVKGYPNAGWATTVEPDINAMSLQYHDALSALAPGIVTAYNIDTNLISTEPVEIAHIIQLNP